MAGKSTTIAVKVTGNTRDLSRALKKANDNLGGLIKTSDTITAVTAVASLGILGIAGVAAGVAAAASLSFAAIPLALAGIGIAAAAQSAEVKSAWSDVGTEIKAGLDGIGKPFEGVLIDAAAAASDLFKEVEPHLTKISEVAAPLFSDLLDTLTEMTDGAGQKLEDLFMLTLPGLQTVLEWIPTLLTSLGDGLAKFDPTLLEKVLPIALTAISDFIPGFMGLVADLIPLGVAGFELLVPLVSTLAGWLTDYLIPGLTGVVEWLSEHRTEAALLLGGLLLLIGVVKTMQFAIALVTGATAAWHAITKIVTGATKVWAGAQAALNFVLALNPILLVVLAVVALVAIFVIAYKKSDRFREIVDKVWASVKDLAANLWEWFAGLPEKIAGFVSGAKDWLLGFGGDLISGLINGVKDGAGRLKDAVLGVVKENVPDAVQKLLGINSPSRVFKAFGKYTAVGLAVGMTGEKSLLRRSAGDMARQVADGFEAPKLTLGARPAESLAGASRPGSGNTYRLDVKVPLGATAADVGREIVAYIAEFEGTSGRRFATA